MSTIVIPRRFNGPPESANGGYTCGLIATFIDGDAEVTLRRPPPLATEMKVTKEGERVLVHEGETLVAEAVSTTLELEVPSAPSSATAAEATRRYAGYEHHEFPTCFTCGHLRHDGLGILPGPTGDGDMVASPWTPDATLPSQEGMVSPEVMWAALDCPGAWAASRIVQDKAVVLGRMAAHLHRPAAIGEPLVAYAWPLGGEGRKHFAGTALATAQGELVGMARQTWISLPA